jgi:CRP/FNR family cyclic AMP-dependent transcriptional regulator
VTDSSTSPEERLARLDLFSGLNRRRLKKLVERSQVVDHEPGRTIAAEGLGALAFHLILDGQAEVSRDGKPIRTLGADEYFGEISIIDGKPRSVTVTAASQMRTLVISYQSFQELLDNEPAFARGLLVLLCSRVREIESRLG